MPMSRNLSLALFYALFLAMAISAAAQDRNHGHQSKKDSHDRQEDCVDNQALPAQGVEVPHDRPPVVTKRVEPEYPRIAKQAGLTGTVTVAILVDRCGKVRDVTVEETTEKGFNDAAVVAVWKWQFRPGEEDGKPVAMWVTVPIAFKLALPRERWH